MAEKYAVIVPVYNSEDSLEELFQRLEKTFVAIAAEFIVVFIDDYSKDNSWKVVSELQSQNPENIIAIQLSKNFGQHNAILCGLSFADGRDVITIDDDLQIPPEEINALIDKKASTQADVIYGIFDEKKHSTLRNIGSYLTGKIFQYFASTPGKGSSFKLISGNIAQKLMQTNQNLIYLDEALSWFTEKIEFVQVKHEERKNGSSGYSFFKLFFFTLNLITSYTSFPLRMMTYFGLLSSLVCVGFVGYFIYMKYTYGSELGFTALITAIFLSTGLILFSLGIIGEYIRRLYSTQYKKPPYSIRTILK